MTPRLKTYFTYFLLCFTPLFLLAVLNYWNGVSRVETTLHEQLQDRLNSFTIDVDQRLEQKENELRRLAGSPVVRNFLSTASESRPPNDLQLELGSKISESLRAITLLNSNRHAVLTVGKHSDAAKVYSALSDSTISSANNELQVTMVGPVLQLVLPVYDESNSTVKGFLVGEVNLNQLVQESARLLERRTESGAVPTSLVIVLDKSKQLLYHTNRSLEGKQTSDVFQSFDPIAQDAVANRSGVQPFKSDGYTYLAAYGPIPRRNIALAVAEQTSSFIWAARRWGIAGFVLALVAALIVARLLERYVVARSRGLVHITEGVSAVAKGQFDKRIELRSSDDARGLADNINVVIEKLRGQIAREEETRQFNSFVRLSAMLTHDLKNAIEALSLTVGNMERHFDNELFRADALKSLTGATDKLKGIVSRLSKPLTSMSGEHKRPMEVDLIPILNRVLAVTAEPSRGRHSIDIKLPQTLTAVADPARIEEVMENLVINALEAMADKKGKLTIEAGRTDNGAATFSVTDTGPGMTQEFIKSQLFKPFATTKKAGVGLGLYTCREVVAAHAGSIEVNSVQGAGTTFRVVLPSTSLDKRK
jgi:signal transduction histidine kinase